MVNCILRSSSSFGKMFKSKFNDYNPYDLRKCVSSLAIHEGNTEKINMLEYNQGHFLNTILKNYNMYNKVDVKEVVVYLICLHENNY